MAWINVNSIKNSSNEETSQTKTFDLIIWKDKKQMGWVDWYF